MQPTAQPPQPLKHTRSILIALLLLALGGTIGFQLGQGQSVPFVSNAARQLKLVNISQPDEYKDVDFSQFWEVWSILDNQYLDQDKLDNRQRVYGAIQGMTSALGDPYTMFLPPEDQQRSVEDLAGAFFGVGIELGYKDEILAVIAPLEGSPAQRAGVQAGDLILHIKDTAKNIDEDSARMALPEAVEKIRGEKGTSVILTMAREGRNEPFDVTLERDEIVVASVELDIVEQNGKKAAHIQLSRFGDRTMEQWTQIVNQIVADESLTGIVLDMRNNPGGYLDGSIELASEFIKDGVVVSQQGRFNTQKYTVTRKGRLIETPVVVLVNKGSASASEILAGALRDRRSAKLVGEKTFGKGTVQDALQLDGGAGVHVTVGRWLLPSGGWIHKEGLEVDFEAKDDPETEVDEGLQKAIEVL